QKSVQEDLKLSEEQTKKVTDLGAKQREAFRGLQGSSRDEWRKKFEESAKETQKSVGEILTPDQAKRLKQIAIQFRGAGAVEDEEVGKALALTDDQKEKLKDLREEMLKSRQEGGGDRGAARKKIAEKFQGILTDAQKSKWKELTGEEFKGEIRFEGPGGRRGRGTNNSSTDDPPRRDRTSRVEATDDLGQAFVDSRDRQRGDHGSLNASEELFAQFRGERRPGDGAPGRAPG